MAPRLPSFPARLAGAVAALALTAAGAPAAAADHAVAEYRSPKYGPNFEHFDYVNPDAPQGGEIRLSSQSTFDSFNDRIAQGTSAPGLSLIYQSLTISAADERFGRYGALAEQVRINDANDAATFVLREEARFHDGEPVTAEDVVWTFNTVMEKGAPGYRNIYGGVESVEALDERTVRFNLKRSDRNLAVNVGQLEVMPKHWWADRAFGETMLEPPVGSGPYRIADFESQRYVEYERVADWWADDLAVYQGRYNFDTIRYDVFRDRQAEFEGFKGGNFDFWRENQAKRWANAYDFPAAQDGRVKKELRPHEEAIGMQGWFYNTRRAPFDDRDVRAALARLFNFEWTNKNLFNGQYTRTASYFENSELKATGLPEGRELELLEAQREHLPEAVFNEPFEPPVAPADEKISREQIRQALDRLAEAGWVNRDGELVNEETGEQMAIEFLIGQDAIERITNPFAQNLERIGIDVSLRSVDVNTYFNRLRGHDFDVTSYPFPGLEAPGNGLFNFFHSRSADTRGSFNLPGIQNPGIDALVEAVVAAESWDELKTATRALDRALLWGHYAIPHYHLPAYRLAYWDVFGQPEGERTFGIGHVDTWWRARDEAQPD